MRVTVLLTFAVLLLGCPPPPSTDAGIDASSDAFDTTADSVDVDTALPPQMSRLRIVNGCSSDMWIFYLIGSGGGSLSMPTPHQTLLHSNGFIDYPIPDIGLAATRFWPGYGCDATGNNCTIGQSGGPSSDGFTCPAAGCAPPIDSKFEGTFGCLPSVPSAMCQNNPSASPPMPLPQSDSWDTSMVDGFTLPYRVRVLDSCSGGPMNGLIDCSTLPMSLCPTMENLSSNGMFSQYASLSMVATEPGNSMAGGCYSDCGRMTYQQWSETPGLSPSDPAAQDYCCPTPPVSPSACRMGPVASSGYTQLVHRTCPQVYAYAYDDGTGLWSCTAGTRYEVTFYCAQ